MSNRKVYRARLFGANQGYLVYHKVLIYALW